MNAQARLQDGNRRVVIDLAALAANYRKLSEKAAPGECAAVVKADAYGLGAERVGPALAHAGCRSFFVATAAEAVALRAALPVVGIYVLDGPASASTLMAADARPVLNSYAQAQDYAACELESHHAIVHIDSGMNRLGMTAADVRSLAADPDLLDRLTIDFVMTHLACADEAGNARNAEQLRRFDDLRSLLPAYPTSIANSPGLFLGDAFGGDLARPGIALLGGNPTPGSRNPMQEVVTLQGRVIQIRDVPSDDCVGYGATASVAADSRLATVAFGYADGYPRSLGNRGQARAAGYPVPVVGRVSMDLLVVDVTEVPEDVLQEGDWVSLVGDGIEIDDVAARAGTIAYEILTGIGRRVQREFVNG